MVKGGAGGAEPRASTLVVKILGAGGPGQRRSYGVVEIAEAESAPSKLPQHLELPRAQRRVPTACCPDSGTPAADDRMYPAVREAWFARWGIPQGNPACGTKASHA
jgi:hypothetical protein